MHTSTFISNFAVSNSYWCDAFHVHAILLDVSFLSGLHTSTAPGDNWLCLRRPAAPFCSLVLAPWSVLWFFADLVLCFPLTLLHQRMVLMCTWNDTCPYLILNWHPDITFAHCRLSLCGPLHPCHILSARCHLQFQIHLAYHLKFCQFYIGTCCLLAVLQTVDICVCTCQMDRQMWSSMMTANLAWDYGTLSLHWWWTCIGCCLAYAVCYSVLEPCVLV